MRSVRPLMIALPLAMLAACSGEPEVPAPEGPDLNLTEEMTPPEPLPTLEPTPTPTPSPTPTFEAAPPPEVEEDQQMLDDAQATGMTARIDRRSDGPDEGGPENLLAPVQE